jgi:hypothetical protein
MWMMHLDGDRHTFVALGNDLANDKEVRPMIEVPTTRRGNGHP